MAASGTSRPAPAEGRREGHRARLAALTAAGLVRQAYATGLAVHHPAGALTERARTGLRHTIAVCATLPDGQVVEAALRLGRLEGLWAAVYSRRDALTARHRQTVTAAARALLAATDLDRLTQPAEAAPSDEARQAAADVATLLAQAKDTAAYAELLTALRTAVIDGATEGAASARMLLDDALNLPGIGWDLAFNDARTALDRLPQLWADGQLVADDIITAYADGIGREVARGLDSGLSRRQIATNVAQFIADSDAAAFYTDLAVDTALGDGTRALYTAEGLASIDFLTAGDTRVDQDCLDAEAGNPWPIGDAPAVPRHARCRCTWAPSVTGIVDLLARKG